MRRSRTVNEGVGRARLIGGPQRHPYPRYPQPPGGRVPGGYQREPSGVRIAGSAISVVSSCNSAAIGSIVEDDDLASTFRGVVRSRPLDASIRETAVGV